MLARYMAQVSGIRSMDGEHLQAMHDQSPYLRIVSRPGQPSPEQYDTRAARIEQGKNRERQLLRLATSHFAIAILAAAAAISPQCGSIASARLEIR
jgi:hypothetical protein